MAEQDYDLVIIGGGPGGYVAAIKAAQLGLKTACIDKRDTLGGTCLNVGCIPSKAMLHASAQFDEINNGTLEAFGIETKKAKIDIDKFLAYKDKTVDHLTKGIEFLFKKNKIDFINGHGHFKSKNEVEIRGGKDDGKVLKAKNIIIATGSEVVNLPGIEIDEKQIVSSTGALSLARVPDHLVVIGGGYIGLELGSVWHRLGAQVTVVEYMDHIVPAMDLEVSKAFLKELQKQGIEFKLATKVVGVEKGKSGLKVSLESKDGSSSQTLKCDVVLSCIGRKPYTDNLGLDTIGLETDDKGRIEVNAHYQTKIDHIYAIGDVIAGPMLAHKAEEEGVAVAEYLTGQKPHVNYDAIPGVVYTHPEVATVGKTEEDLKKENRAYKVGKFPFTANSRARANNDMVGFVKIIADAETDEVLGVHIMHSDAGTMIAECVLAMEYKASSEDIARTCHAHPTLSEAVKEAALAAHFKPFHM